MKTRNEIESAIAGKVEAIKNLQAEIGELERESILLSDDVQQFTEEIETVKIREGRKLIKKEVLVGRIYWKDKFEDTDTGEWHECELSQVVRMDGKWNW